MSKAGIQRLLRRMHQYQGKAKPGSTKTINESRLLPSNDTASAVKRTSNTTAASIQHMGVDHCGLDILVTQQLLNGADVIA